ncbi:hypothetical protein EJB05_17740, partial [Eragrostis curvula]
MAPPRWLLGVVAAVPVEAAILKSNSRSTLRRVIPGNWVSCENDGLDPRSYLIASNRNGRMQPYELVY